jgi:ferredoxin
MLPLFHRQGECIGCDSCTEIAPDYFRMNDEGLAELIRETGTEGPYTRSEGFEEDRDHLQEAAEACPVQIIHLNRP